MIRTIGVGAGGHAKVVIEILRLSGKFEITCLLSADARLVNSKVLGIPVTGDDSLLPELFGKGHRYAFIGLGSSGDMHPRRNLYDRVIQAGFQVVAAIHPNAVISPSAVFGPGVTVMAGAVINSSAVVGENVIVNTGAIVEHDCQIGRHVHLATGCRLAGNITVGDNVHIGAGACIKQGVSIGRGSIVGAGAVVLRDVREGVVMVGVPARELKDVLP